MSIRPPFEPHGAVTDEFAKEHLKVCVAKMCKRLGWDSISQTALLVLVDLLCFNIRRIISTASKYANDALNLDITHVALALSELDLPCTYTDPGGRAFKFTTAKDQFEIARLDIETNTFKPGFVEVHKWLKKCKKSLKKGKKKQKQRKSEKKKNLAIKESSENEPPKEADDAIPHSKTSNARVP